MEQEKNFKKEEEKIDNLLYDIWVIRFSRTNIGLNTLLKILDSHFGYKKSTKERIKFIRNNKWSNNPEEGVEQIRQYLIVQVRLKL